MPRVTLGHSAALAGALSLLVWSASAAHAATAVNTDTAVTAVNTSAANGNATVDTSAGAAAVSAAGIDTSAAGSAVNPYSPAYGHPYRHGVVPTISQLAKMNAYQVAHPGTASATTSTSAAASAGAAAPAATGPQTLSYGGGIDGIGVMDGHAKVYLVFYGNQWGTQGTDANGNATFSGDPDGAAPVAQQMFKGIGTGSELWSADLTQWCDGPNVAAGATSCPANANFVPYQSGGVLAGVWYDNSGASPGTATGHQLGQEAVNAAGHFGNTNAALNRNAYYVILSPHNTNPDSYFGAYCAWHDYNGDSTLTGGAVSSPYGDVAFSNQPYNMDFGTGCGVGFVNSPGTLDGYTITMGHEWHETMSDQNPAGGWTNHTGSAYQGQENSDECAWIRPGQAGGAANVAMGNGTYAEQASWSNDTNACAISHPIVNHGGITLRAHANGLYVTADNVGASSLIANHSTIDTAQTFDEIVLGGGNVALRAHANGLYVTAENAGASPLIANRTAVGAWETFQLIQNADGSVSFLAQADGKYVTAENTGTSALIANRTAIGPWEEFDLINVGGSQVDSFRAHANSDIVTAENAGSSPLIANRTAIGLWEQFDEIDLGGGNIALRAHANGMIVTADNSGTSPLIANRAAIGPWETFQLVHNADGSVSFLAQADGEYVTAENAGASSLIANRTAIGPWEEFDLIKD